MEILEVEVGEYSENLKSPYHAFGSAAFNHLNRDKCAEVIYLLFKDSKYRSGIIGGVIDDSFYSPYSAPFGGFSFVSEDIRLQYIEESIDLLIKWAGEKKIKMISITPPPPIYEGSFQAKQVNCLWRRGFKIKAADLNYSFDLNLFGDSYQQYIWYNARKNLNISMKSGMQLHKCVDESEKELSYDVIRVNRQSRGYPLRMTWQQVSDTVKIIPADFFLIYSDKHVAVASAIVYSVNEDVVQVIYWGDLPGYSEIKPMNFLAYKVFEYYKEAGRKIVDIGPSTENSVPNYGLCEFKEGIGCRIDPKFTFVYNPD